MMTPDAITALVLETRGIALAPDSARRIAGMLAAQRKTLDALTDETLFDAEPAQMAVALMDAAT
jgi:hypothetical protein